MFRPQKRLIRQHGRTAADLFQIGLEHLRHRRIQLLAHQFAEGAHGQLAGTGKPRQRLCTLLGQHVGKILLQPGGGTGFLSSRARGRQRHRDPMLLRRDEIGLQLPLLQTIQTERLMIGHHRILILPVDVQALAKEVRDRPFQEARQLLQRQFLGPLGRRQYRPSGRAGCRVYSIFRDIACTLAPF